MVADMAGRRVSGHGERHRAVPARRLTEVRCRRQTELTGHRGRKGDPLWAARRDLLRSRHNLTAAAWERLRHRVSFEN